MVRERKTKDEWHVETNYGYGWETECVEDSRKEAVERVREYRANTNAEVRLRKRRIRLGLSVSGVSFRLARTSVGVNPVICLVGVRDGVTVDEWRELTGTAEGLCRRYCDDGKPNDLLLILLDRLEECPAEVAGAEPELVGAVVAWVRKSVEG